ncbi:MAG: hypothetical protein Q9166_008168 [cf. Caloplaca sp. 2 TL-2023]
MESLTDSSVDKLAARATVKTYDDIRSITPPPDEEEDAEESRLLEAQARKDLESDGCPACYSPTIDVPMRNPPAEYRLIVGYWQSFSSTGDVVLCAQRSDWRNFRASQIRVRSRYPKEQFSAFVDEVRERRRRHGLGGGVRLLVDLQQQSQQENWIEFQNYHLKRHDRLEKERDGLKEAGNMATIGSGRTAQNEEAIQRRLEFAERTLRWHEVFLQWTEQQRLAMNQRPPTPIEEESDDRNAALRASIRQRRSRRPNASAFFRKARVSKSTPKSRNMRVRTFNAPNSEPIIVNSVVATPSSIQQVPKPRETKPRHTKGTPLGQLISQRVSKVKRSADTGAKSRPGTQRRSARQTPNQAQPQRRSIPQRLHPAPGTVKTQIGRTSRPPVRWAPE